MSKIFEKLKDGFNFVFNDTVIVVGEFICCLLTLAASLSFVITGIADVILPRIGWVTVFGFMLVAGTRALDNLVYPEEEDEEEFDEEDEEFD